MNDCVIPGSFDPPTRGHLDLIRRASFVFDEVTVAVMVNRAKEGAVPLQKRADLLRKACRKYKNVKVDVWDGLLAEYMRRRPGTPVIRGIRNAAEFEQEITAFTVNKALLPEFETIFIPADHELAAVSSSAVREVASFGGDIRPFIPEEIQDEVWQCLHC